MIYKYILGDQPQILPIDGEIIPGNKVRLSGGTEVVRFRPNSGYMHSWEDAKQRIIRDVNSQIIAAEQASRRVQQLADFAANLRP